MPTPIVPLTFAALHIRLLRHIRERVANGEMTERSLARAIGVSQPHMHNVLKGARGLTSEIGDLLVGALGLSLLDLAETEELGEALEGRREADGNSRQVRLVQGTLSPFERFPEAGPADSWVRLPEAMVARMRRPALMAFIADLEVERVFEGATHVLLDLDETGRLAVQEGRWYALRWGGAGYVRQVRREGATLVALGQTSWRPSRLPGRIPLGDLPMLSIIRGRVEWCGPDPRSSAVKIQSGSLPERTIFS